MTSASIAVRGTDSVEIVPGIAPAPELYLGQGQGKAWVDQVAGNVYADEMGRIAVWPQWVWILDFEARFPSALSA